MTVREPPVGSSDSDSYHDNSPSQAKIKQLEEERDSLQKSMITLTSRMAQIEFRMSQALSTPDSGDKDELLRNLSQESDFYLTWSSVLKVIIKWNCLTGALAHVRSKDVRCPYTNKENNNPIKIKKIQ